MSETADVYTSLFYSNRDFIPVEDLAASLMSYGKILQLSAPMLRALSGCQDLEYIHVYLHDFKSGSADENFIGRFIFKSKKGKDDFIRWLRKVSLVSAIEKKNPVLGTLWALLLVSGATFAAGRWSKGSSVNIENVQNSIINTGPGTQVLTPEVVREAMREGVRNRAQLAANSVRVIRPAKLDPSAVIRVDGRDALLIPSAAISEVPMISGDSEETLQTRVIKNTLIDIRALDRDNKRKGWAAIVPAFSGRRAKLELLGTVNPLEIEGRATITGDVEVVFRVDAKGSDVPKRYYLSSVSAN